MRVTTPRLLAVLGILGSGTFLVSMVRPRVFLSGVAGSIPANLPQCADSAARARDACQWYGPGPDESHLVFVTAAGSFSRHFWGLADSAEAVRRIDSLVTAVQRLGPDEPPCARVTRARPRAWVYRRWVVGDAAAELYAHHNDTTIVNGTPVVTPWTLHFYAGAFAPCEPSMHRRLKSPAKIRAEIGRAMHEWIAGW